MDLHRRTTRPSPSTSIASQNYSCPQSGGDELVIDQFVTCGSDSWFQRPVNSETDGNLRETHPPMERDCSGSARVRFVIEGMCDVCNLGRFQL
jgi:hypothetical protein